jgi:nucleoside-diphosphate-sugar epimerase
MSNPTTAHHLVIGAGPVGTSVTRLLVDSGTPVTLLTRSGSGPDHPLVTRVAGDAADVGVLLRVATGAAAIYNCVNPPYRRWATDWPPVHRALMAAAERTGAVLVMMDNLYGFGEGAAMPMREGDPLRATGTKGRTRAMMATELLDAHASGRLRATLARASDFYGPLVREAVLGERVMPKLLRGKKVSVLGSLDQPHSFSYMPDVARTLVTIATDERAWGKPWHVPNAPAVTQRDAIRALAAAAGTEVGATAIPYPMLRVAGLFVPVMRELRETWYQFAEPFVTDSTLTEQTFGLQATPLAEAAAATVAWWRAGSTTTSHSVHIDATRG